MANRRIIKKDINGLMGDVIEECYMELLSNPGKNEIEINAIIDEAVDLADNLIAKTNNLKNIKDRKAMKLHFQKISTELEEKAIGFIAKLNAL